MICKVTMQRPDGSRARHVGHYPNPGMAMDVVQAMNPECAVNVAVNMTRSCEDLGLCQSTQKTCASNEVCARSNSPFYFAPRTIDYESLTHNKSQYWFGGPLQEFAVVTLGGTALVGLATLAGFAMGYLS